MSSPTIEITSEIVPKIAGEVKAAARKGIDLREFQGELYRRQRAARTSGFAQSVARSRKRRHRLRVRQPAIKDCNVIEVSKDKKYFELSNGQRVRAERAEDRGVRLSEKTNSREPTFTLFKGRRKLPFKNILIRQKVCEKNLQLAAA